MRNISVKLFWMLTSGSGDVIQRYFLSTALVPFCLREQNHLCNFGRGHYERHFCEIILNLDRWFRRKSHLKLFLIYNSGGPFLWQSGTIYAILVEIIMRIISVKLFWIKKFRRCCLNLFLIYSSDGNFSLKQNHKLCIFGKGLYEKISVKLFWIWTSDWGDVI